MNFVVVGVVVLALIAIVAVILLRGTLNRDYEYDKIEPYMRGYGDSLSSLGAPPQGQNRRRARRRKFTDTY